MFRLLAHVRLNSNIYKLKAKNKNERKKIIRK